MSSRNLEFVALGMGIGVLVGWASLAIIMVATTLPESTYRQGVYDYANKAVVIDTPFNGRTTITKVDHD